MAASTSRAPTAARAGRAVRSPEDLVDQPGRPPRVRGGVRKPRHRGLRARQANRPPRATLGPPGLRAPPQSIRRVHPWKGAGRSGIDCGQPRWPQRLRGVRRRAMRCRVFSRNRRTGALTSSSPVRAAASASARATSCLVGRALNEPTSLAVSPDGERVYVTGRRFPSGVAVFTRGSDGSVTQPAGPSGCVTHMGGFECAPARGLSSPEEVAVSPDSRNRARRRDAQQRGEPY